MAALVRNDQSIRPAKRAIDRFDSVLGFREIADFRPSLPGVLIRIPKVSDAWLLLFVDGSEFVMLSWLKKRRRRTIISAPFPEPWRVILRRRVKHVEQLPESLRTRLEDCIKVIVAERTFEGVGGLELNDDVRVTIAGQASLLLLGVDGYYFDRVPSILVYPESYVRPGGSIGGLIVDEDQEYAGEAWKGGPIVLSWRDVLRGGDHQGNGNNVVVHEFAHHLDGLDGDMGGMPPLSDAELKRTWEEVSTREFANLVEAAKHQAPTLLDHYGATNLAEFFAVSSECFFEQPRELQAHHPQWYQVLAEFYRSDPAGWDWTW